MHEAHTGHNPDVFKRKFWLSLLLTMPAVLFSGTIQGWTHIRWSFTGSSYVPAIFGIVIFCYGGWVFIKGARAELAVRRPGMMTLISMAITVAFVYSLAITMHVVQGMDFWWELATLVTIMLLGHWLEMASVARAASALSELAGLLPDEAELIEGGTTRYVTLDRLQMNDLVLVRPGGRIPVDGEVVQGASDVDEALLTGESRPVPKSLRDAVVTGSINGSGTLTIRATKVGSHTALAGIMRLVGEAQQSKSSVQILADRAAFCLTFVALGSAAVTALFWFLAGQSAGFILTRVVAVLIIACPHALGLAIPLVVAIATTRGAKNGILVRDRRAFEAARGVTTVLFDKTGTLTNGKQGVENIWATHSYTEKDILRVAAAIEQPSEHSIGRAIALKAKTEQLALPQASNFRALPGSGVQGMLENSTYYIVSPSYAHKQGIFIAKDLDETINHASHQSKTIVIVAKEHTAIGAIALSDQIRPESFEAVARLQAEGVRCSIVTGDTASVAAQVAQQLHINTYIAEVRPEEKVARVQALQADGEKVAMVGDGVNDAPALAQADTGIAIGGGTDVAVATAGVILASNDPRNVARVIRLSRATYRKMLQNLAWAAGYNVIAIPIAAGITAPFGFVPSPALGAVLMSLSTIIVAANAQTLRRNTL